MRNRPVPALSALSVVVLLVSACTGDASASDSESSETPIAESESTDAEDTGSEDEYNPVLVTEAQLAEGVELPDCLAGETDTYVDADAVLSEAELLQMCPAEPAEDREFRPSQQIIGTESGVEIRYLPGEDGAGVEVHHLHCEDEEALAAKAEHNGGEQPVGWPQDWGGEGAMPDPYCHPDYLEIGEWKHLEAHSACWEGIETSTLGDQGQSQDDINEFLWEQSQARAAWQPNPAGGTCAEQWAENDGGDPEDYSDIGNADEGGF